MSEPPPELSVVIPCHNEEGNLRPLVSAVRETLVPLDLTYEIVITDDFSSDNSWSVLKRLGAEDPRVRALKFAFNCGQSAALFAGMKAARGKYIVTLDADLQNDPGDIPKFLEALRHYDCVCGTRVAARRRGDNFSRVVSSRIANRVRNRLSGETISDAGCCFRAFKRECITDLKFFNGMHRFLPTLFRIDGFTVTEIPIRHHPRAAGRGHYGIWNRLWGSFYDLVAVRSMRKRMFRYEISERWN